MTQEKETKEIRKKILKIISDKKRPITPSQILKEINPKIKKPLWMTGLKKDYLKRLMEGFFILKLDKNEENHREYLKRYNIIDIKKEGVGRGRGYSAYYISTEHIGKFKEIFDTFLIHLGFFIENKDEIKNKVKEICRLLSIFEVLNDYSKSMSGKIHYHTKSGKIRWKNVNQPLHVQLMSYKERKILELRVELYNLWKKQKKKGINKKEKKRVDVLKNIRRKDLLFQEIQDKEIINVVNEIFNRIGKCDSRKMVFLVGRISREIDDLIYPLYKQTSFSNILNKITTDLKKSNHPISL